MKFSVLLPTRNRLELLRWAIETVRRQDYDDWEVIVSDNASEDDVAGHVRSLRDTRIRYVRTPSFVPVTDNWNNALRYATGDYIVMLGDDDGLLRGFFRTVHGLIERFHDPDCIYTNGLLFAYPGVMQGHPDGFLEPYSHARFLKDARTPFLLDPAAARALARQSMNFKMLFTYNMQHSVVNRAFIGRLAAKGPFFQSPYPDFYATNVLFLTARSIVVNPLPLVAVGISPKSFGFYYFNDQEKKGVEFLNNLPNVETARRMAHVILPGLSDKTAWLLAMETIKVNYGSEFRLSVGYDRYRYLQVLFVYGRHLSGKRSGDPRVAEYRRELDDLKRKLKPWERALYLPTLRFAALGVQLLPRALRSRLVNGILSLVGKTPQLAPRTTGIRYENALEVYERVDPAGMMP